MKTFYSLLSSAETTLEWSILAINIYTKLFLMIYKVIWVVKQIRIIRHSCPTKIFLTVSLNSHFHIFTKVISLLEIPFQGNGCLTPFLSLKHTIDKIPIQMSFTPWYFFYDFSQYYISATHFYFVPKKVVYMVLFNDYIVDSLRAKNIYFRHLWNLNTRSLILELVLIILWITLKTGKEIKRA